MNDKLTKNKEENQDANFLPSMDDNEKSQMENFLSQNRAIEAPELGKKNSFDAYAD